MTRGSISTQVRISLTQRECGILVREKSNDVKSIISVDNCQSMHFDVAF